MVLFKNYRHFSRDGMNDDVDDDDGEDGQEVEVDEEELDQPQAT